MGSIGANRGSAGSTSSARNELARGEGRVVGRQDRNINGVPGDHSLARSLREKYNLELESSDGNYIQNNPKSINGDKVTMYEIGTNVEYEGTFNMYSDGEKEIINIRRKR